MKTIRNKIIPILIILIMITTGLIFGLGSKETAPELDSSTSTVTAVTTNTTAAVTTAEGVSSLSAEEVFDYSKKDLAAYTEADADYTITLDNESVEITEAGVYLLSGSISDGQVVVNATSEDDVILILDGVDITSTGAAAIEVEQADKVILYLAEGSENSLQDVDSGTGNEEGAAVIYSKDDLTISGSGSLLVTANRDNGIQGKDDVTVMSGNITILSADDGIVGKDSIVIRDGNVAVTAYGDALKATNDEAGEEGYIAIEGGTLTLQAAGDALQAEGSMLITDGEITIVTGSGTYSSSIDQKGLKANNDISITGGELTIYASDDAIHSDNSVQIDGGTFYIVTTDDGIHADETLVINDGEITIAQAYEGLESQAIYINGGNIDLVTSDDGLNAAGGTESAGSFGRGMPSDDAGDYLLQITGGTLTVTAEGDGLDSNGYIVMTGGTVTVYGPTGSGNGSLDYNGTFEISGGTLITAGSTGMIQTPSESSTQYSVQMTYSSTLAAGTVVELIDSDGTILASVTPETRFQAVLFSLPGLDEDETYSVVTDSSETVTFTASGTTTWLNESGVTTAASGFGGGMGPGGRGFRSQT